MGARRHFVTPARNADHSNIVGRTLLFESDQRLERKNLAVVVPRMFADGTGNEACPRSQQHWTWRSVMQQWTDTLPQRLSRIGKAARFVAFIEPSLATLRESPPKGPQWVHEIKYDGYRV